VTVTLTAGHRMTGRIVVDGAAHDARLLRAVKVSVLDTGAGLSATMLAASAPVDAEGAFQVRGLIGRRVVRVTGLPPEWVLKSVRADGIDLTDDGVEIHDDVAGVEIVLTTRSTLISGAVTDAAGKLVPGAAVIIFPEARERRVGAMNRFVATARTGADGNFTVRGLPPASYFAIAVPALVDGEWAEPEQLERMAARATRATLAEGESKTVGLRLDVP
jgi:hypothetical protein